MSLSQIVLARNIENVYLVAGETNKEIRNVIVNENDMVKCNCRGYKFTKFCSHSVAISEEEDIQQNHLAKVEGCRSRAAITYPLNSKGSGKKGDQKRRERSYKDKPFQEGIGITVNQSPFTKTWHTSHPLKICSVLRVTSNKSSCGHCENEFPRGPLAIVPFDIVISNKERWEYLNRHRATENNPKYLPPPANFPTTWYQCIQRHYIYNRFLYFGSTILLVADDVVLTNNHKKNIKEQLNVTLQVGYMERGVSCVGRQPY